MIYQVTHDTPFGCDDYFVECDHRPNAQEVVAALQLDYEPDEDESLEVYAILAVPIPPRRATPAGWYPAAKYTPEPPPEPTQHFL